MDIKSYLESVKTEVSNFWIITPEEGGLEAESSLGDICIAYDFGDLQDEDHPYRDDGKFDEFSTLMDNKSDEVIEFMKNQGYVLKETNDGSGNGMYYGAMLFTK